MDDDAKITRAANRGASTYACDGELRNFMQHSTEQMGGRAEGTRVSRFERLTP
jgi:hypothetical protein